MAPKNLKMTVENFNQKYKGKYCLKEDGEYSQGFHTVYDNTGAECGVFRVEDNYLMETQYSLRTFGFVDKLDSGKEEPAPARRCIIL
ncbi:MAG: hypothetical protein K2Q33_07880 [Gammaproteobacteria bacterium]|nr:hypothetical protein [Gammaproteobacteria bacterium]